MKSRIRQDFRDGGDNEEIVAKEEREPTISVPEPTKPVKNAAEKKLSKSQDCVLPSSFDPAECDILPSSNKLPVEEQISSSFRHVEQDVLPSSFRRTEEDFLPTSIYQ